MKFFRDLFDGALSRIEPLQLPKAVRNLPLVLPQQLPHKVLLQHNNLRLILLNLQQLLPTPPPLMLKLMLS